MLSEFCHSITLHKKHDKGGYKKEGYHIGEKDMGEKNIGVKIDLAGAVFMFMVFVLIILFWGDPDIHDGIIHRLMSGTGTQVQTQLPE